VAAEDKRRDLAGKLVLRRSPAVKPSRAKAT
jgi:hypothetical protein